MANLADWIDRWAETGPDRPAIVFEGDVWSYASFAAEIARAAAMLAGPLALAPGARIAHLGLNSPTMLALFFACARVGAIFVPLNWRLAPPELAHQLQDSGACVLFADDEFAAGIENVQARIAALRRVTLGPARAGWERLEALLAEAVPPAPVRGGYALRVLIGYTSGTTGRPKGAVLDQSAFLWNAVNSLSFHDLTRDDRILTMLPMFHLGGLNIQTVPALHAGACVYLYRRFDPGEMLDAIARHRITLCLMVPAVLRAVVEHPRWLGADLSSLRCIGTGSSIVPLPLIQAMHARGVPVSQVYGSTETAPIAIVLHRADAARKPGSCGMAALHCDVRLVDDRFADVAAGEKGEVVCRGPNVMREYWNDPAATRAAFTEGWFHTGDIAHRDADGFFFIDDRKKDMIISGGENIYPAEIEAVLAECADIAEAAVVARPDARWGEVAVAFVARKSDSAIDAARVMALFPGRLAKFKWPAEIVFVDSFPRTALGKVQKNVLRARLGD